MSLTQDFDYLFKFLLIGNSAVGKSSLLLRFSDNIFNESFLPTIGVDFKIRTIDLGGKTAKLQIWDTAGQERFKTITATYYKGAHGIILVYDITDKQSFRDIDNWLNEVEKHASENVVKLLVGNKCDLESQRQVTYQEGKELADSLGLKFLETSAKDKVNVDQSYLTLVKEIQAKMPAEKETPQGGGGRTLKTGPKKETSKGSKCC